MDSWWHYCEATCSGVPAVRRSLVPLFTLSVCFPLTLCRLHQPTGGRWKNTLLSVRSHRLKPPPLCTWDSGGKPCQHYKKHWSVATAPPKNRGFPSSFFLRVFVFVWRAEDTSAPCAQLRAVTLLVALVTLPEAVETTNKKKQIACRSATGTATTLNGQVSGIFSVPIWIGTNDFRVIAIARRKSKGGTV